MFRTDRFAACVLLVAIIALCVLPATLNTALAVSNISPDGWGVHYSTKDFAAAGIWCNSTSDVFLVGTESYYSGRWIHIAIVCHYNGSLWSIVSDTIQGHLSDVWGSSSTDVFAVGGGGTIIHYDGSSWSPMDSPTTSGLGDVWGSSSTDVFAVGFYGTILHYNGSAWSAMTSGTEEHLYGVWGTSSSNVFAVGAAGTILHYNGSAWSAMTSGTEEYLYGVWGSSSSDVFVVGSRATILHYDAGSWSTMSLWEESGSLPLHGVWGSSQSDVFVVGDYGVIGHYDGSAWQQMDSGTNYQYGMHGVSGNSTSDVYAVATKTQVVGIVSEVTSSVLHYREEGPIAPRIYSVSPEGAYPGDSLSVTLTGKYFTNTTKVGFSSGVTVKSFAVDSDTQITATIEIPASTNYGYREISVTTTAGSWVLDNGFRVLELIPGLNWIDPQEVRQGESLTVTLKGLGLSGAAGLDFGLDVTVDGYTVESDRQITAQITVDADASLGPRSVYVIASPHRLVLDGVFTVEEASLGNHRPSEPTSVSPANGATDVGLTPTLCSSAFADPDVGNTHAASQWQITATGDDYSSPIYDSSLTDSSLIRIVLPSGLLSENTTYYWRVRHQDSQGTWSVWSSETSFTTGAASSEEPSSRDTGFPSWIWVVVAVGGVAVVGTVAYLVSRKLARH